MYGRDQLRLSGVFDEPTALYLWPKHSRPSRIMITLAFQAASMILIYLSGRCTVLTAKSAISNLVRPFYAVWRSCTYAHMCSLYYSARPDKTSIFGLLEKYNSPLFVWTKLVCACHSNAPGQPWCDMITTAVSTLSTYLHSHKLTVREIIKGQWSGEDTRSESHRVII